MAAPIPPCGLRVPLYLSEAQATPATVAVTGASGFLSSALVKRLLAAGHVVHGTARNPADQAKLGHLLSLPGAAERLRLFKADLLQPGSFDAAFQGCRYVVHAATPVAVQVPKGKGRELVIDPAVRGVENVLAAVQSAGSVEAVVMTSSLVAVMGGTNLEDAEHVFTEEDWNDLLAEDLERLFPYALAKVESEKRAWELAGKQQPPGKQGAQAWRLAVVAPAFITGPPDVLFDSDLFKGFAGLLGGKFGRWIFPTGLPIIDVDDCAAVHILAMLNPNASGRYLCSAGSPILLDLFREAHQLRPEVMSRCTLPDAPLPKWLAWLVCKMLGTWPELVDSMYGRQLQVDSSRTLQELGAVLMEPSRSLADMAQRMLDLKAFQPRRVSCCRPLFGGWGTRVNSAPKGCLAPECSTSPLGSPAPVEQLELLERSLNA